jgi:hypothetical protein
VVLGGHAKGDEVKVSCTVRRDSAFWDALGQLQQQGILQQQHQDSDQADGRVMLAKLFPRFVDDQLSSQQHQQQGQPLVQGLPGANRIPSSMWSQQPFAPSVSASVEAGEGHGPRKEFFQAAAHNWTTAAPQQVCVLYCTACKAGQAQCQEEDEIIGAACANACKLCPLLVAAVMHVPVPNIIDVLCALLLPHTVPAACPAGVPQGFRHLVAQQFTTVHPSPAAGLLGHGVAYGSGPDKQVYAGPACGTAAVLPHRCS